MIPLMIKRDNPRESKVIGRVQQIINGRKTALRNPKRSADIAIVSLSRKETP
jgi:hypothetical protein